MAAGTSRWAIHGPDRVLAVLLALGLALGGGILHGQARDRIADRLASPARDLSVLARQLDGALDSLAAPLQVLAVHAAALSAAGPDSLSATPLGRALLTSQSMAGPGLLLTLDRLPPPYLADNVANVIVQPDPAGSEADWRRDAALAVGIAPLLATLRRVDPRLRRLVFTSVSGVRAMAPWMSSRAPGRLGLPAPTAVTADLSGRPVWLAGNGTPPTLAVAALPRAADAGPVAIFALEVSLADVMAPLSLREPAGVRLFLVDARNRILAGTSDPLPAALSQVLVPGDLAVLPSMGAALGDHDLMAVQPLAAADWRLVAVAPRWSVLGPVLWTAGAQLAGLLAVLAVLGLTVRQLLGSILRERETAVAAERGARAASDRALDDLRAAHDELDFLNREKTRFFSLISHDLRGPFNTLLGMTQELAEHAPSMRPEDVAEFARSTHESARQVHDLLENLLQWSRVQMSGKPFMPSAFALRDLVADGIRDVTPAATAKQITVLDAVGDRWVLADRTMILAVLRNLLVNAVKFSHPGGVVHLTSRARGDRLEVAVTDHGIGMDPQQVQALLRPGAGQPSRPGTQGEQGTGLGMTLVRDMVMRHGGGLEVDSEPGRGTTIRFTLPLTLPPGTDRLPAPTPET